MAKTGEVEVKRLLLEIFRKAKQDGIVGDRLLTSEIRPLFDKYYSPTEEDREILANRGDDKLSQVIRNIPAHQSEKVRKYPEGFTLTKPDKEATFSFEEDESEVDESLSGKLIFDTELESEFSHNRIIFGAPGTGKSFTFNKESVGHENYPNDDYLLKKGGEYERVTFHPDYSYAQFVGTYKPTTSVSGEFIPLLSHITSATDVTPDIFQEISTEISGSKDDGKRTLLLLLGLKFPDDASKKYFLSIAKSEDSQSNPDTQINYAVKAAKYISQGAGDISYEYVPGPFMRTLVKALKNKRSDNVKPHLLLIEEINRANVAAVFGDVFQLLDRDDLNQCEYPIQASEDVKKYLVKELGGDISDYEQIRIPDNMFIWATMNSADQGVYPMDTAFKRRWDFTYQGINEGENDIASYDHKMGGSQASINWNDLRKAINAELITYNINEDKLMGAHFVKKESLKDKETFDKTFKSKVIMYLFDDAAKQKRATLFAGVESPRSFKLYSDICEAYDEIGIGIFSETIKVKFDNQITTDIYFEEL